MSKTAEPKGSDLSKDENPTPYAYFVSYAHRGGFGWIEVRRTHPLNSGDQIKSLNTDLNAKAGVGPVSIIAFQRIDNQ